MKGIILAGGSGSRLYPSTISISKQLLTVYDKPMIYYPLSVLMLAGIREILIITTPNDLENFRNLLGNGNEFGLNLSYKVQKNPDGLAQAFILGEDFIGKDSVCLILGDNIFHGSGFVNMLQTASKLDKGATIFGYWVPDPERFGVVELDKKQKPIAIIEKPQQPKSNYAVTGLYFYDNQVVEIAKSVKPSRRGELEISDVNNVYLNTKTLSVNLLGRGFAWLDTGTHESMLEAANFIHTLQFRLGLQIGCLEEIAYRSSWIDEDNLKRSITKHSNSSYGSYLESVLESSFRS